MNPGAIPEEALPLRFELWPNPTEGNTIVQWSNAEVNDLNVILAVVDISRTEVIRRNLAVSNEQTEFDISELAKGVYIVQLKTESGNTGIRKLLKQ